MNKFKETYDRPTTDVLVIRFEESFLSNGIQQSNVKGDSGWNASGWEELD